MTNLESATVGNKREIEVAREDYARALRSLARSVASELEGFETGRAPFTNSAGDSMCISEARRVSEYSRKLIALGEEGRLLAYLAEEGS